ncbi:MAG TPA: orotate phosphoribosyltransferase, partial [Candidatus Omnitrophota bacterium]|nr:orotate phosphoribosyltransferase [Candidatus Omnitrophota bacterium]
MEQLTTLQAKKKLLELILKEAYFKEKIILSSGKQSDFYIDARRVTLKPEGAWLCSQIIFDMIKNLNVDAIGGPTLGADPMVGAIGVLSLQSGNPINTFIIRKAPKPHGKQQQVEGPLLKEGDCVVLIDDVATTGKAFLESLDVLNKMNIKVEKCICLVDRDEGAREAVRAKGSILESVFHISEIHQKYEKRI